jgi:cytochrome o ubiquinol oxidase subunit 1
MAMTRRMQHDNVSWQPWLVVAAAAAVTILVGIACRVIQLVGG